MKIAIMQPYFFPYLGYYSLLKHTNRFILFDTVQFIRHGWIERNRVLKQNEGWLYIQVPLNRHSRDTKIRDVTINNELPWKTRIIDQLKPYKKKAPYYAPTIDVIDSVFSNHYDSITHLNEDILTATSKYLNIECRIDVFSRLAIPIEEVKAPDEWALNICKGLKNVNEYWNPIGGKTFFDKTKYDKENIKLRFQKPKLQNYDQRIELFEPGLSIIDVMMFNSVADINMMLDNFELE
jgi:hypothetical protein